MVSPYGIYEREQSGTVPHVTTFEQTMLFLLSVLQRDCTLNVLEYNCRSAINEMYSMFNTYNQERTGIEPDNPFKILIDTGYKFNDNVIYKNNIANYFAKSFSIPYRPQKMNDVQKTRFSNNVYSYDNNDGSVVL
jgi:hypothetical protein